MAGGCIYLAGGHNLEQYMDTIERYDPRTPKWRLVCPQMHAARQCACDLDVVRMPRCMA